MRQIWIPRIGDPSVLDLREAPNPDPAPGEVRVAVEAAGVNFADLMCRMGLYPDGPPLPAVVGYEVAGEIDAVGEGVDADLLGRGVVAMTRFGGYSSAICVPAAQVGIRPEGLDAVTAAAGTGRTDSGALLRGLSFKGQYRGQLAPPRPPRQGTKLKIWGERRSCDKCE